ncbi:MAG TPA: RidA family protein [Polyangiaceae bacterium]|nr:RidA family protein [Polyangiaceae bacterium]
MNVEAKLKERGLELPAPLRMPPGIELPFTMARIRGRRVYVSGHGPLAVDGSVAGPFGHVGDEVTVDQAYASARLVALAVLSSLQRALGDLDRVTAWLRVFGMVNAAPGFGEHPRVINGFSDLILAVYGKDIGAHARSAVGMSSLPFGIPVEVEAEVEIDGG